MEQYMWTIWLAIFVITLIVEVSVNGLISVWFSFSALMLIGLSFIEGLPWWGEVIIFILLSIILVIATRPLAKRILKGKETKTNVSSLEGQEFKLIKKIDKFSVGELKINGVLWDAKTIDDVEVEEGKTVRVISVSGNKLIVEEVKNDD